MRKFTSVILLSTLLAFACADVFSDFTKAVEEWTAVHPAALDIYTRNKVVLEYYGDIVANYPCFVDVMVDIDYEIMNAANEWSQNKSRIGVIVEGLLYNIYPPIMSRGRSCVNSSELQTAEAERGQASIKILEQNPLMKKALDDLQEEVSFLGKSSFSNDTCLRPLNDLLGVYDTSMTAQFVNNTDVYALLAKMTYVMLPRAIKLVQKCLIGDDEILFGKALGYWFDKNPELKATFDVQDDMINSLTKTLPHDDICAQKLNKQWISRVKESYALFRNGEARIGELAGSLISVSMPELIEKARDCVTI